MRPTPLGHHRVADLPIGKGGGALPPRLRWIRRTTLQPTAADIATLKAAGDAQAFVEKTGIDVLCSYRSTAQLALQMANGAPFELFAAADTEHIDKLIASGTIIASSRAGYGLLRDWAMPTRRSPPIPWYRSNRRWAWHRARRDHAKHGNFANSY